MKSRKSLVHELDKAFSDFIRERDGWRCVLCDEKDRDLLDAGHFLDRGPHATRWLEDNVHCQCKRCNFIHMRHTWPYTRWMIEHYGQARIDELYRLHNTISKFSNSTLEEWIKQYRNKRAELMLQKAAAWN